MNLKDQIFHALIFSFLFTQYSRKLTLISIYNAQKISLDYVTPFIRFSFRPFLVSI